MFQGSASRLPVWLDPSKRKQAYFILHTSSSYVKTVSVRIQVPTLVTLRAGSGLECSAAPTVARWPLVGES